MSDQPSVAAVFVTFNRRELLRRALHAVQEQTRPVQEIFVADNHGEDGTAAMLAADFPDVTVLRMEENLGPAGGFARAIQHVRATDHDWLWAFNDDDWPETKALERLLEAAAQLAGDPIAIGGWARHPDGSVSKRAVYWRHRPVSVSPPAQNGIYQVDVADFNGLLLSRQLLALTDPPREEYFMQFWMHEYCLRAAQAGGSFYILSEPLVHYRDVGQPEASTPPWRGYFQSRNHLALALERQSLWEVLWWFARQLKFVMYVLLRADQKWERITLRLAGASDALRGRLGKRDVP